MSKSKIKDINRVDDYYSRKARQEGYPARSIYKLAEIEKNTHFLKKKQKVLDLGCFPGSWLLYAAQKVGPGGFVLGLDLKPLEDINFPPWVKTMTADLLSDPVSLVENEAPFDVVLSDMAPKTMGRRDVDQARSLELVEMAWSWAFKFLKPGGSFFFKIFQSQEAENFIISLKSHFKTRRRYKPQATRKQSLELFVLAQDFFKD